MRFRAFLAVVALCAGIVLVPSAAAKFRISLVLGKGSPAVGQPLTVSLRTDTTLPAEHSLRLIAVAPGRIRYDVVGAITGASSLANARIPRDGFEVELVRVRADRWRGIVSFPRRGRWQLVVPNWGPDGFAIPPPLVRWVVVR
jgi:hypothetical protein